MKRSLFFVLCSVIVVSLYGCRKPYNEEKYVEVKNHETAFVVPLEDDMSKQKSFGSVEALEKCLVATKRIVIPRRWHQSGRWEHTGRWIDAVMIILVDRSPVTREWTAETDTGTKGKDEAIWVESKDSVGFSTGFNCTAYIKDSKDAAVFLYTYPNQALSDVMDNEIRARVQAITAEVSANYDMDSLRGKKNEIISSVRQDVKDFFSTRGITITTIGMFGGFTYENPNIQAAIDNVFVAQQEKNTAKAMLEAQADKNSRIEKEAEAFRNAAITKSEGEAKAIQLVAQAAAEANSNPAFLELKKLEVETKRIEKWNGQYPQHLWTTSGTDSLGVIVDPK